MRVARPRVLGGLVLVIAVAMTIAGCGGPTPAPIRTDVPGPPATQVPRSAGPVGSSAIGQTETSWGRIWDTVPDGFASFPGSVAADDAGPDPTSATVAVEGGDPAEIAGWMQAALEGATYSTEALSGPFEDGRLVLESVGDGGCRIQTTVAPLGSMTFVRVLYGAGCPAP